MKKRKEYPFVGYRNISYVYIEFKKTLKIFAQMGKVSRKNLFESNDSKNKKGGRYES